MARPSPPLTPFPGQALPVTEFQPAPPCPGDPRGQAARANVGHPPRVAPAAADVPAAVTGGESAGGRASLVLRRVVEQLVTPWDDDVQRLVAGRLRDEHIELAGAA